MSSIILPFSLDKLKIVSVVELKSDSGILVPCYAIVDTGCSDTSMS